MGYNVAIVGAGLAAELHASALEDVKEGSLAAVYNRSEENGKEFAKRWDTDYVGEFSNLLSYDQIDFISVCTPTATHSKFAIPAAKAGKNLVVEKPLEKTPDRCDEIIRAAENNDVYLSVIFQNRFKDPIPKIKTAVEKGDLGRLILGTAEINWYRPEKYYRDNWKGSEEYEGGGALINQGIHTIDLLQWIMGNPIRVNGQVKTLKHDIEGEDVGVATLEFSPGSLGVITGSTATYPGVEEKLGIYGTEGTIELKGNRPITWETTSRSEGAKSTDRPSETDNGGASDPAGIDSENHRRQWQGIIAEVKEGGSPPVSGPEARKSIEIIHAIYRSSQEEKSVKI